MMRWKLLWACALAILPALAAAPPARSAIVLALDPAAQTVTVGDSVMVDLNISGLGNFAPPSLGAWDMDIGFDTTVLGFTGASFGNQLDLFGLGSISGTLDLGGVVNLFEVSLDLPSDLDTLQAGAFTLASLTFDALSAGTSALSLTVNDLGDSLGDPLGADQVNSASVTVQSAVVAVSEPPSLALLVVGLLGLAVIWRVRNVARP